MTNNQEIYQDDEIDLRKLLTSLWRNKLLILAITAIFSITGVVYAVLAPQVWSAKAIVVAPSPEHLEQLHLRLDNLVALTDVTTNNNLGFSTVFSEEKLFTGFIQAFDSFDNKGEFLLTNGYVRQEDVKGEDTMQRLLIKRAQTISVTQKKNEESKVLSCGSDNAKEAEKMLKEYLDFIQTKEMVNKNKLLAELIANKSKTLALTYQAQETDTLKRLQEDIARTEIALRISRAAGIEAPVENLNDQNIFKIDLGAKALNEKLNILKEIKNPVLINPALANIRLQLDSLQAVPQDKVSFSSYHFLQSPSEPLSRDKPKRSLVVVLATMAGLMVGVMIALIRASWFTKD